MPATLGRPIRRSTPRRLIMLLGTLLVVVLGASSLPATGSPDAGGALTATTAGSTATPTGGAGGTDVTGQTFQVTLLTGDVVSLHVATDGRQAAWIDEPADPEAPEPQIYQLDGDVHVVPAEATPYIEAGVLDDRLFDVTSLVEQGYHDAARDDLPLLITAPDGASVRTVPQAPPGTTVERELASLGAVAVAADTDRLRETWESLRGALVAADGPKSAALAGAGRIWLNGRVEATLDESVAQVGAPEAWEAGFDGGDVPVAVLDSGYDPAHPDLAGQVESARNFTDDEDPAGLTAVDGHGHGTHVAATIAGTGAASDGARRGVAPGADLMIGKVLNSAGAGYEDWIIAGMEWAVAEGAKVINLSLGGNTASDGTDPMSQAVNRLSAESGALFVVAAGNTGPRESSITSPGAADLALTVGAVTKDDEAAEFSARGPRLGDRAVKPEIVAPGVGIVAARAAGTSLGDLVDEHYTALNGTSMATPHAAGAAAVLAQQHPDWDGTAIKARLTSTSSTLDGAPVTFQGAGRLDVAAAVGTSVTTDAGAVSFGRLERDTGPVHTTLAYHNPTDRRVTLTLSADLAWEGPDQGETPRLRFGPPALSIPAGGTATTDVTLATTGLEGGDYAGHIIATDPRNRTATVHTATSFTIDAPTHTVTVTAVDRQGRPAKGPVDLWNTATFDESRTFLSGGVATFEVPEGTYTAVAALDTPDDTGRVTDVTVAGHPELAVTGDVTIAYDARDGEPVTVDTPLDADTDTIDVSLTRTVGERSVVSRVASVGFGESLSVVPSPAAEVGTFEWSTTWQLTQPLLTARTGGPDAAPIMPSPQLATPRMAYVGETSLPVVDVGLGTSEEFGAAEVEGKIALVSRDGQDLGAQIAAAEAAGAAFVLAQTSGRLREERWNAPLPAYLIGPAAGAALRQALADDPGLTLDVSGVGDATYAYELAFTESGGFPGALAYDTTDHPLATVVSDYRQDSERMGRKEMWTAYVGSSVLGNGMSLRRNGPVVRTEYVSAEGVDWQRFGQPHGEFLNVYWTWSAIRPYAAKDTHDQVWWGPLTRPSVPPVSGLEQQGRPVARFDDAIRISMPHYRYGDGVLFGTIDNRMGDTSEVILRRDGEVVGTDTWPETQFTVPAEEAAYELELDVVPGAGNWKDTSVATNSVWRFRSARTGEDRTVLPLVNVDYDLETGARNEVAVGAVYPLVLRPGYQPQATGPGGFEVTVEVSFDDGATWTDAPVETAGGVVRAAMPAAAEAGFATVRVTATDDDGNSLTQRIDRAWRIG